MNRRGKGWGLAGNVAGNEEEPKSHYDIKIAVMEPFVLCLPSHTIHNKPRHKLPLLLGNWRQTRQELSIFSYHFRYIADNKDFRMSWKSKIIPYLAISAGLYQCN